MARYYIANQRGKFYESAQLSSVSESGIDVFISHQSADSGLASKVAVAVQDNGLSVWLDLIDCNVTGDGPHLANYIADVLCRSNSLLAIVTANTKASWWVPFELGIAFELSKYLASFGDRYLNPSFLEKWPNIPDQPTGSPERNHKLRWWCEKIRNLSPQPTKPIYLKEMSSMSMAY